MEMRELKGDDLFPLLEIVGKLDIKDEFVALFDSDDGPDAEDEQAVEKRGMEIMANLLQTVLKTLCHTVENLAESIQFIPATDVDPGIKITPAKPTAGLRQLLHR